MRNVTELPCQSKRWTPPAAEKNTYLKMQNKRITMKDIAKKAEVHQTTVSLALRNHPSLPKKTIERIRRIADEMGYRPDPMLTSLISYRSNNSIKQAQPTIGYIMDLEGADRLEESQPRQLFLESAKTWARKLGYKIEVFYYTPKQLPSKRLDKILQTRNIRGLILAAFWYPTTTLELSWDRYSVVKIEMLPFNLNFDVVENNQMQATRLAMKKARLLGYKRVGLAVAQHDEKHTRNLFSAGYLVAQQEIEEANRVPMLVFDGFNIENANSELNEWLLENEVDAVISNWNEFAEQTSSVIGNDVNVILLDADHYDDGLMGVVQNHEEVGRYAIERVTSLMSINKRGMVNFPTTLLIDSNWREGKRPNSE